MAERKILQTKRNYWLLLSICHFVFHFFLKDKIINNIKILETRYYHLEDNYYYEKQALSLKIFQLSETYFILILISFIIVSTWSLLLLKKEEKIFVFLWMISYSILALLPILNEGAVTLFSTWGRYNTEVTLGFYFLFIPYFFLIINNTILGVKVNVTPYYIDEGNKEFETNEEKLIELKNNQILNDEEFKRKRNEILIKKIRKEFMLSEEYQKLIDLKKADVLTIDEFNNKIEEIINKKLNQVNS